MRTSLPYTISSSLLEAAKLLRAQCLLKEKRFAYSYSSRNISQHLIESYPAAHLYSFTRRCAKQQIQSAHSCCG